MERTALRVTVLQSVNNEDASRCVDIFRRPDGSFGFEEFRRDPEDPGRGWYAIGGFAGTRFTSEDAAAKDAVQAVSWFTGQ